MVETKAQLKVLGVNIETVRLLLQVIIFISIAGAAISSRLFSVIRYESIITNLIHGSTSEPPNTWSHIHTTNF